ncbi:hypothetical protein AOLI_G00271820 [Acnodon oligacanthus]
MRGRGILLLFVLAVGPAVPAGTHSLHITFMIQMGISSLPEGMSSTFFDEEYIAHYNSSSKTLVSIQNWVKEGLDVYWSSFTHFHSSHIKHLLHYLHEAKQLARDKVVHTLQRRLSCQLNWNDVNVSDKYGYDGETFISLDKEHKYVTDMSAAETTVRRWNRHEEGKNITNACVNWLKRIGNQGKHHLHRAVSPPEVSFLQKAPSSPVVCFATGFYPRAVKMSWQRNGEDVSQDVSVRETLPNNDGTFQKTVSLSVTPEEWNENQYSCVVQHKELRIVKNQTEEIKTNYVSLLNMSVFQETPSSPVVCLAKGIYPKAVKMLWRRNGEDVHEDVDEGETLPYSNGTFKKTISISLKPKDLERNQYSCVLQYTGANEGIIKNLTAKDINTNYGSRPHNRAFVLIPFGLLALVLLILFFLWKKHQDEYECLVRSG